MLKLKHLSSCFFFEAMNTYEKKNENLKLDDIFPEFSVQTLLLYSHFIKKEIKAEKKSFEILLESLIFADFIQDKNYEEWISTQIGDLYRFNKYEKKKIIESISFVPIDVKVKKAIIASWLGRLSFLYEEYFSYREILIEKFLINYESDTFELLISSFSLVYSDTHGNSSVVSHHTSSSKIKWPILIKSLSRTCCRYYYQYHNIINFPYSYKYFQDLPFTVIIFTPVNNFVEKEKQLKRKHVDNFPNLNIYSLDKTEFSKTLQQYDSDYYDIENRYEYLQYYLAVYSKRVIYLRKYYRKK